VFGLMFAGFNAAFFPMHVTGLLGMPRRVYTYAADLGWNGLNLLSTVGAFVFAAGVVLFAFDAWRALRRPEQAVGNPWHAATLEWLTSEAYGNRSIPRIESANPLWDRPGLAREVEEGRHYLPDTATGARETIATSPIGAVPRYLLVLPGDSWLPLIAAAGTAAFFLLLTVKLNVLAWICGLAAVAAVIGWMWASDRPAAQAAVDIGGGIRLPVGAVGRASHSWWATAIMLVVDLSIFACFAFAYVHVSMRLQACAAASFVLDLRSLAGLDATASAWGAAVATLCAYQGLHIVLLAILAPYLALRAWCGHLGARSRASLDNIALVWHATTLQGIAGMLTLRLVPLLME
jgi:cytochrome c oxidase subunit I+III